MPKVTGLHRRGAVYYIRRRIPSDLLTHYAPKVEIWRSLETRERADAVRLLHRAMVDLDREFDEVRRGVSGALSDAEIDAIAEQELAALLAHDDRQRLHKGADWFDSVADGDHENAFLRASAARGEWELGSSFAEDVIRQRRLTVTGMDRQRLALALLKVQVRYSNTLMARQNGDVVESADVVRHERLRPVKKQTLGDLLDAWGAGRAVRPKTAEEVAAVVTAFEKQHGKVDVGSITKRHVREFVQGRLAAGRAYATVKKNLSMVSTVLAYAVDTEVIPANPAAGVTVPRPAVRQRSRLPFTVADLTELFSHPVFTEGARPLCGRGDAAFWLPLIGLFSGARLEEIAQLRVDDVRTEQGVTYFNITDDAGGSLKTEASRRRVPVHPELVRIGLLDYVERMRAAQQTFLFPRLEPDANGKRSGRWSKWFNGKLLRALLPDTRLVFHSTRHAFKDALREAGVAEDVSDALTGHGGGRSVGRSYGSGLYPLRPLAAAIERVTFEGLDLSGLKPDSRGKATP